MGLITIYNETEKIFNSLGLGVIQPSLANITEELNSIYELELTILYDTKIELIKQGRILGVDAPTGRQHFRIYKIVPSLDEIKVYARHIFYDLLDNFIENVSLQDTSSNILQAINNALAYPTSFKFETNINKAGTVSINRENPVSALLGNDSENPKFIQVFGGELLRNNCNVKILTSMGQDKGYTIRYGKNLLGMQVDEDYSTVITKLYAYQGGSKVVVDSEHIDSYPYAKIGTIEFSDGNLTEQANNYIKTVDTPIVNISVEFELLSKTEEYKNLQFLEDIKLGDIVTIYNKKLNFSKKAKVIKYSYNCLTNRYNDIQLGDFLTLLTDTVTSNEKTSRNVTGAITASNTAINTAIAVSEKLNQYIQIIDDSLLVLDTQDINTAKTIYKFNKTGISKSTTGIDGEFTNILT